MVQTEFDRCHWHEILHLALDQIIVSSYHLKCIQVSIFTEPDDLSVKASEGYTPRWKQNEWLSAVIPAGVLLWFAKFRRLLWWKAGVPRGTQEIHFIENKLNLSSKSK